MLRNEFDHLIDGYTISDEDYKIVEVVYTWHPSVENKMDIARLYLMNGGMRIIRDMLPTAQRLCNIDTELARHEREIEILKDLREDILQGRNNHES